MKSNVLQNGLRVDSCDGLYGIYTHVQTLVSTLGIAQVDIHFLLLVLLIADPLQYVSAQG